MIGLSPGVLPQSPPGRALTYPREHWSKLVRYLENGDWPASNNPCHAASGMTRIIDPGTGLDEYVLDFRQFGDLRLRSWEATQLVGVSDFVFVMMQSTRPSQQRDNAVAGQAYFTVARGKNSASESFVSVMKPK